MIDFKIKPVLNPKGKRSQEGEAIYLCINRKTRHYINLHLEKIPKKAWSGKPLKWVNNQYPYAGSHNLVIAREIHHLKEIIQDFYKRNELLTSEKLKKIYEVKHQGKRIKGVNGEIAPGASDSIVSYIGYSLTYGAVSKKSSGTKKVYVTLKNLIKSYRSHAVMADIDEGLVMGFVKFLRSDATEINSDNTVAKYVDRLKVIYREYCDQYGITFKKRFFDGLDVNSTKGPDKINYVNDKQYESLEGLRFSPEEKRLEITRDIFLLFCNTALYYNDLVGIESESGFDPKLLGNQFKWANNIKTLDYDQTRDSQEIGQTNSRTRAKYGEGSAGRSGGARPDGRGVENHTGQPESPEQEATSVGRRTEHEACFTGRYGEVDDGHGKYSDEFGEAAEENEEDVDGHLLHGDRSAPGIYHGSGFKDLGIDIVPEEESDRRRRKRRRSR